MYFVFAGTTATVILGIIWALAVFNRNSFIVSSISNAGIPKNKFYRVLLIEKLGTGSAIL
jgi:hypothetical protein